MKINFKLKEKFKPLDTAVLGIIALIRVIYFHFCITLSQTVDSGEYINASGTAWLTGNPDRYRLPAYPLLIDVCQKLFGQSGLEAVCVIQLILSVMSIVALYLALKKVTNRSYIYLPITIAYGLSPIVFGWDKVILTESLALSFTVFILFGLIYYLKTNKLRYLGVAVFFTGAGALMRSVFALYVGVIFAFLIIRLIFTGKKSKEEKKRQRIIDAKGITFAVIPVIVLMLYAGIFYSKYDAFTLSDSGLGQQLTIVLKNNYYHNADDEEIKKAANDILYGKIPEKYNGKIDSLITEMYGSSITSEEKEEIKENLYSYYNEDTLLDAKYLEKLNDIYAQLYGENTNIADRSAHYNARNYIMNTFERERVSDFINQSKEANTKAYILSLRYGTYAEFSASYENGSTGIIYTVLNPILKIAMPIMNISILQGLIIGLAELFIFLFLLLKKKEAYWIHLGLATVILATGLLSILGTNAEFGRTAITMYPMLFIVFAMWTDRLMRLIIKKEVKEANSLPSKTTDEIQNICEKGENKQD